MSEEEEEALLDESSQNDTNHETPDRIFIFVDEIQFFVSNHNFLNQFVSATIFILFICYSFISAFSVSPVDNPEIMLIDFLYLTITGTISSPPKSSIINITLALDLIFSLFLLICFLLSLYVLLNKIHIPFAIKTIAILLYYIIPLMTPMMLVVLSRAYNYLNISENNELFLFSLIINVLIYSISSLVGLCNTVSAYRVDHIFSAFQPFHVIAINFLIAISHQLIGFVTYPSKALLIVSLFIQFAGILYLAIRPPYASNWMATAFLTYYIFSFGVSLLKVLPFVFYLWMVLVILGISIVLAIIVHRSTIYFRFTKFIGSNNLPINKKNNGKIDITKQLSAMNLNLFNSYQMQAIIRSCPDLPKETILGIFKKLDSEKPQTYLNSLFLYMFGQKLKKMKLPVEKKLICFYERQIKEIDKLKINFWTKVYNADFTVLSELASEIGHDRSVLKLQTEFQKNSCSEKCSTKQKTKLEPFIVRHKIFGFSVFHLVLLIIFILSILSQFYLVLIFRSSYQKFIRFTYFKYFLSYLTITQVELWPTVNLGPFFDIAEFQWDKIKTDELFDNMMENSIYREIISEYLTSLIEFNKTKILNNKVYDKRPFEIFRNLFLKTNKFFEQSYQTQTYFIQKVSYSFLGVITILYVICFVSLLFILSNREHRFFSVFSSFSKKKIQEFANLQNHENNFNINNYRSDFNGNVIDFENNRNKINDNTNINFNENMYNNLYNTDNLNSNINNNYNNNKNSCISNNNSNNGNNNSSINNINFPISNFNISNSSLNIVTNFNSSNAYLDSCNNNVNNLANNTRCNPYISVPLRTPKVEWRTLKYLISSFLLSFTTSLFLWGFVITEYTILKDESEDLSKYIDKTSSMTLAFAYYSAAIFYGKANVSFQQILHASKISDEQFNLLSNIDTTYDLISLVPDSVFRNLGSYFYESPIEESEENLKTTIIVLYESIDLNDAPLYQFNSELIVRFVVILISSFMLTVFAYFGHNILNFLHYSSIDEKYSLLAEFNDFSHIVQSKEEIKKWNQTKYSSDDLPLVLLVASSDMRIIFATNLAKETLKIDVGMKITDIDFGLIHSSEILNAIHDMKNNYASDPIVIQKEEGKSTIISPSFQMMSCIKTLHKIVLIDDVIEPEDIDESFIYESVNPFFKVGDPESFAFKNDQVALISLKLIGLSEFCKRHDPSIVKEYLITIIKRIDEFEDFTRTSIRNNTILVVSRNITFSSLNQFISVCADFAMKAQEMVSLISRQFGANIFCSVLFHRCEGVTLKINNVPCGQCDFASNLVNFIDECHSHFLLNAIGFVPRTKMTQILNMSKIMTVTLKNEATADIFIFI